MEWLPMVSYQSAATFLSIDLWAPKPLVQVDEAWVQEVTTKVFE
jgi:hypothetical protein